MPNPDDPYLKKAEAYVFKTKEEWTETKNKVDLWEEKRSGYTIPGARSRNADAFDKYKKDADADRLFDGSGNIKRYGRWVAEEFIKDIAPLEGVWTEFYYPEEKKAKFIDLMSPKIVGKKGWLGEEAVAATPENKETAAEAAVIKEVNASLSPEREKELIKKLELSDFGDDAKIKRQFVAKEAVGKRIELEKERERNLDAGRNGTDSDKFKSLQKEYDELIQLTDKLREEENRTPVDLPTPKITDQKEKQIKQNIDQGKKQEGERLAQKEEARQSAANSGVPSQPDQPPPPPPPTDTGVAPQETQDEKCPCGSKLTEGEKSTINWGRSNSVFQNPMASQINNAQGGFADTLGKINKINGVLGALGGSTNQLTTLTNRIGNMQGILSNYANESNRLSGLPFTGNGPDLLSLVSTVGAAVNFQCALGIEGLDVGLGIGLMTENGKLKLNTAISVNADISKLLDGIDLGSGSSGGIMEGINKIGSEINNVTNKLNEVAGEINGAIDEVNGLYNDALDFVSQFTSINFAMDFAIDECTKFGVGFQQGILNPEFIQRARAANPLNNAANPGFGSSFR